MKIGILGSGLMGGKLGSLWARAGHNVAFSYARSSAKLEELAREAGPKARAAAPREAVSGADAILWAVHWLRFKDVIEKAGDLTGKLIVTCSLAMNEENTELVVGRTSSAAEELQKMLPKSRVVSAFNTIPSEVLYAVYESKSAPTRPSLVYCGDDAPGKDVVSGLIRDIGFEPIDAGPLRIARYTEPFALLIGQLAYEGTRGDELSYRLEWRGND